jgi:hypothetical protein
MNKLLKLRVRHYTQSSLRQKLEEPAIAIVSTRSHRLQTFNIGKRDGICRYYKSTLVERSAVTGKRLKETIGFGNGQTLPV